MIGKSVGNIFWYIHTIRYHNMPSNFKFKLSEKETVEIT